MNRVLHIFCGPYPTHQGTQVLVGQTCRLSALAGNDVHLLTYSHGAYKRDDPFTIHRIADRPRFNSERSKPTWQKPLLDISMALRTKALCKTLKPDILHVHHYEALLASQWARTTGIPTLFHLHALFGPELGTYVSRPLASTASLLGKTLDRYGPRLADLTISVHPWIREQLLKTGCRPEQIRVIKPPADHIPEDILAAPKEPGIFELLYTGNLDGYQDLNALFSGLERLPAPLLKKIKLKIITASKPNLQDYRSMNKLVFERIEFIKHSSHAQAISHTKSADVVVVPRQTPGGTPIKMINALSAGALVLADSVVADGISHGSEAWLVDMSSPDAIASALTTLLHNPKLKKKLHDGAIAASKREHSPDNFIKKLHDCYSTLSSGYDSSSSALQKRWLKFHF